jgi:hypothetical protein
MFNLTIKCQKHGILFYKNWADFGGTQEIGNNEKIKEHLEFDFITVFLAIFIFFCFGSGAEIYSVILC